jgi:hypothetical protein
MTISTAVATTPININTLSIVFLSDLAILVPYLNLKLMFILHSLPVKEKVQPGI